MNTLPARKIEPNDVVQVDRFIFIVQHVDSDGKRLTLWLQADYQDAPRPWHTYPDREYVVWRNVHGVEVPDETETTQSW